MLMQIATISEALAVVVPLVVLLVVFVWEWQHRWGRGLQRHQQDGIGQQDVRGIRYADARRTKDRSSY